MVKELEASIQVEIDLISQLSIVPKLLDVICRTTGMGFAAIARVTENKWIACSVLDEISFGLKPGGELQVETTLCHEVRYKQEPIVINHVENDPAYYNHPTPAMYGFQSYISVPIIRRDGAFFGTLCAIDPKPIILNTPETISMFNLFADLISFHLNAIEQMALTQAKLVEEHKTATLREQFIAILGHDLRNPVGAVANATQLMLRMPLDERMTRLTNIIRDSNSRIKGLIENMLDFAQGHLGPGISLNRNANEPLETILNQVVTELRVIWTDRDIKIEFALNEPVNCDGKRIAQLFSNLLSNALAHGNKDTPVSVKVLSGKGEFILSVANFGDKIPDTVIDRIFQPFSRGIEMRYQQGLGLGLYISSEIARAHGGTLNVVSSHEETIFTLRIPA